MTEAEWLIGDDADRMLTVARRKKVRVGPREQRLLACGWARLLWDRMDACCRKAVEAAERYTDGTATRAELAAAHDRAMARHRRYDVFDAWAHFSRGRVDGRGVFEPAATKFAWEAAEGASRPHRPQPGKALFAVRLCLDFGAVTAPVAGSPADVLRDVVGNPFRPAVFAPEWRTTEAVGLAKAIYAGRAFDRLTILADALEDAGCDDPRVLGHCRAAGPHVRGCWVVDTVLAR